MADNEDLRWMQNTTNDLNNLLQVISESSESLQRYCTVDGEGASYFAFLRSGLERATQVTSELATKLGGLANRLPVTPMVGTPSADAVVHNPTGQKELIMLVDDEELVLSLARRVLTAEGYRVVATKDPFEAVQVYRLMRDQIGLVILDFTMPGMDGAEVFAEMQKINRDVGVVLSSGFAEQSKISAMLARGLRGFLPKPYTHEKLLSQIRSTLDILAKTRRPKTAV